MTAKLRVYKNYSIHHSSSTILLQELAEVEQDYRGPSGLTLKFAYTVWI